MRTQRDELYCVFYAQFAAQCGGRFTLAQLASAEARDLLRDLAARNAPHIATLKPTDRGMLHFASPYLAGE